MVRYSLVLSHDVAGIRGDADVRVLIRAQDLLGRLHDHQVLIAQELQRRRLAVAAVPEELSPEVLLRAASGRVAFGYADQSPARASGRPSWSYR